MEKVKIQMLAALISTLQDSSIHRSRKKKYYFASFPLISLINALHKLTLGCLSSAQSTRIDVSLLGIHTASTDIFYIEFTFFRKIITWSESDRTIIMNNSCLKFVSITDDAHRLAGFEIHHGQVML